MKKRLDSVPEALRAGLPAAQPGHKLGDLLLEAIALVAGPARLEVDPYLDALLMAEALSVEEEVGPLQGLLAALFHAVFRPIFSPHLSCLLFLSSAFHDASFAR